MESGTGAASAQEHVYDLLKGRILELSMLPGTTMSTNEVALQLFVSRTPVREAFLRLEEEGLVLIEPKRGTTVSRIDPYRVMQERFLRESLLLAGLAPFVQRAAAADYASLHEQLAQQAQAVAQGDYRTFFHQDNRFHETFFIVAGQELCNKVIQEENGHYYRVRVMTSWSKENMQGSLAQHRALVEALEQGRLEQARTVLSQHLYKLLNEEKELIREHPDYFVEDAEEKLAARPEWHAT